MTELENNVIDALIEAGPATDPFVGPVQDMGTKLGFRTTTEARTFTEELVKRGLIRTRNVGPAEDIAEAGGVVHMLYRWERA